MAVDEARRHALHENARRSFGVDSGDALMEYLPPVGWADVATKHDLAELEARMNLRFEVIEARFAALDGRFEGLEGRFEGLEGRLTALIQDKLSMQNRTLVIAAAAAIIGSIIANVLG